MANGKKYYEQQQKAIYAVENDLTRFKPNRDLLTDKKAFDMFCLYVDMNNKSGRSGRLFNELLKIYEYYDLDNDAIMFLCDDRVNHEHK